jgi:hypothetical protein
MQHMKTVLLNPYHPVCSIIKNDIARKVKTNGYKKTHGYVVAIWH